MTHVENQAHLATILEGTSDFVGFADAAGNALYVNAAGRQMIGLGERDPLPTRIRDFHPERLLSRYLEEYLPAAVREGVWRGESAFLARDGREIPVSQVILAHRNEKGEVERFSTIARDITSEKRVEASLRESEERFREIAENIREVFWVVTPDLTRTLYLSPAFETLFGRRREQVYQDPLKWAEAIHPDDRERALATVRREAPQGAYQQIYRAIRPDGSVRWVRDRAFPVRDASGALVRIVGLAEDITDLKRVEEELRKLNASLEDKVRERTVALRESERFLDSILNSLLTFTVLLAPDGRVLHVNEAPLRASGLSRSEVMGRCFWDFPVWNYSEESGAKIRDAVGRAAAGETVTGQFLVQIAPGRFLHMAAAFQPIRDPQGRVVSVLGEGLDVTEHLQAKEALEASEKKFRSLVATVPGVVYRCETALPWRMLFISEAVLDLTGYPPSDFMEGGRTWASLMAPEDIQQGMALTEEAERTGKPGLAEYRIRRADGTIRWVLESGQVVKPSADAEPYADGVILDITPQKIAEAALEKSEEERLRLEELTRVRNRFEGLVGKSAPMQEVYRRIRLAAQSDVTVLVTGESGTGKELAAQAIHSLGPRHGKPFIAINCSAIPETLLESELFGHVRGAFTGAVRDKVGVIEAADGGTLLLDEVAEMSPAIQVKLLRALQDREIRRVGGNVAKKVDVRLLAATNRNLRKAVETGALREDFYYRIKVFELALPPLRDRREDVPLIVDHLLATAAVRKIHTTAMRALLDHPWPGNVRELKNVIEQALVTARAEITIDDLPAEFRSPGAAAPALRTADEIRERQRIVAALKDAGGNRLAAAKRLGISRVTLWKRIKALGIDPKLTR